MWIRISNLTQIILIAFLTPAVNYVCCANWDSIVDDYFPVSLSRQFVFGRKKFFDNDGASITQSDVNLCIRQGHRLAKTATMPDIRSRHEFPTLGMHHFFTSNVDVEAKSAGIRSRAMLLGAKILQNKMTASGSMTPNTFMAYLESRGFKAPGAGYFKYQTCLPSLSGPPLDGYCNNEDHPSWGAAFTTFTRVAPSNYADGIFSMPVSKSGDPLPSPRLLSSKLFLDRPATSPVLTALASNWGQFIAHDLTLRVMEQDASSGIQCCSSDGSRELQGSERHWACAPILVSHDDPFYSKYNVRCLNFVRSMTAPNPENTLGPAEQLNAVSGFLDASSVYGTRASLLSSLRTYRGGQLRLTADGFLPSAQNSTASCDCPRISTHCPCYQAGDPRVNQSPVLVSLQTILAREHNRLAGQLMQYNPHWSDERLFIEARRILIAEIQHITYYEWLPLLIGKTYVQRHAISPSGLFTFDYNPELNPGVINSFATAAFRFFHSLVPGDFPMRSAHGREERFRLSDHYLKPHIVEEYPNALDQLIRGATSEPAMDADSSFTSEVTNLLFKSTNDWGLDLAAIDIQRGRDHGLAPYNTYRLVCSLKKANSFEDLADEISLERIDILRRLYKDVDDIDLFVGGTMEKDMHGSLVGKTFQCIFGEQFYRTRAGDKHFYSVGDMPHSFTAAQLRELKKSSIARLICDNTDNIQEIQSKAFESKTQFNPLSNRNDYEKIPVIDLKHWKEY